MKVQAVCLCGLLSLSFVCYAEDRRNEQLSEVIQEFLESQGIPGLAVSVGLNGSLVFSEGFGYADLENRVPVNPQTTKFRVGSVVKPMTSAAAGTLVDAGKLKFDDPVQKYVPTFPTKKEGVITTRMLESHRAGIRSYTSQQELFVYDHYTNVVDALKLFADDPLEGRPGGDYKYSVYGYVLLSAVIQGASGVDFLDYMHSEVFTPLQMHNTVPDNVRELIEGRAGTYVRGSNGLPINAPYTDNSYKWASGGFLSTSEDLVRFAFGIMGSEFLSGEMKAALWTDQVFESGNGVRVFSSSGRAIGGSAVLIANLAEGKVVAITTNYFVAPDKNAPEGGPNLLSLVRAINPLLTKLAQ